MFDYFFRKGLNSPILSVCFSLVCFIGTDALDTQFFFGLFCGLQYISMTLCIALLGQFDGRFLKNMLMNMLVAWVSLPLRVVKDSRFAFVKPDWEFCSFRAVPNVLLP